MPEYGHEITILCLFLLGGIIGFFFLQPFSGYPLLAPRGIPNAPTLFLAPLSPRGLTATIPAAIQPILSFGHEGTYSPRSRSVTRTELMWAFTDAMPPNQNFTFFLYFSLANSHKKTYFCLRFPIKPPFFSCFIAPNASTNGLGCTLKCIKMLRRRIVFLQGGSDIC